MKPISLHPDNPHYFLFRGRPAVLVSSAEHYGALLNADFDYDAYLETLERHGFNLTRVFSGAYLEQPGAFRIRNNTLAPQPGRLLAPWARSNQPGYRGGGNRFDLNRWDDAYFKRLDQLLRQASRRGVVVELVLYCPFYEEAMWELSPLNAANNVNGVGDVPRQEVWTLKHPELVAVQDRLTRRLMQAVRGRDNVYVEICNEPYAGGHVSDDWQEHTARTIVDAERDLPADQRHLIARNIANRTAEIRDPDPLVSIFNFHYAAPPTAVATNYHLDRPIAFDESGFRGTKPDPYRQEAWEFLLAGGAVYNNLDYSYTTTHPRGDAPVDEPTPGSGGPELRRQLQVLKQFMERLPFTRMRPDPDLLVRRLPGGCSWQGLSEPRWGAALYARGTLPAALELRLSPGRYRGRWIDPVTGSREPSGPIEAAGGVALLPLPSNRGEVALHLERE